MNSQGKLDAPAIDDPIEYVRLAMAEEMQVWVEAMDDICCNFFTCML